VDFEKKKNDALEGGFEKSREELLTAGGFLRGFVGLVCLFFTWRRVFLHTCGCGIMRARCIRANCGGERKTAGM